MMTMLRVAPLDISSAKSYDALVATVGYEARASYVGKTYAPRFKRIWAFDYHQKAVLSYEENREFFDSFETINEPETAYRKSLAGLVSNLRDSLPRDEATGERVIPQIAVDISSMDRDRIAMTVLALTVDQEQAIHVDFLYAFGEFDQRLVGSEGAVLVNRPIAGLEGWSSDPDAAVTCVVGLGFESRLATAAIETIEPHQTIALLPKGDDDRYDVHVRERNAELLRSGAIDATYEYAVGNVFQTVMDLNASVDAWTRGNRVAIVPLGPKPFALAAVLVGAAHSENVSVWRLSADVGREPEERVASGAVVGLSLLVEPRDD